VRTLNGRRYYSTAELARALGLSSRTIARWFQHPDTNAILKTVVWFRDPVSSRFYFDAESVRTLMNSFAARAKVLETGTRGEPESRVEELVLRS
jgi:hypothetical protein